MAHNMSHRRPVSADSPLRRESPSMLYSMLPSAVKSRLPSLRRSVSMYGLTTRSKITDRSFQLSGSTTPEGKSTNAIVWSGRAEGDLYVTESGMETSEEEDVARPERRTYRQSAVLDEDKSGIGWKFANQGFSLFSLAADESLIISRDPRYGNPSFARQLYIHAIIYLLRALPDDLTVEEQLSVRTSLPPGVVPLQVEGQGRGLGISASRGMSQPSILHRTLASTIVQLFILFQFILPYIKYTLNSAYQYDRTHKISERVLSGSISTVEILGKRGILLSETVLGMGDGKMAQVLAHIASWLVEGVAGGIQDGLGEGMVIIGAVKPASGVFAR